MELEQIIKENLAAINEDYDILKPFMQNWLKKVEAAIQSRHNAQTEAVSTLKGIDYSVKAIATEIGASRTTMYNHEQLLRRYIEQSAATASSDSPYSTIARLQTDKANLQDKNTKLMQRDVEMALLKAQNRDLSASLEGKNAEIERLQKRISELSEENQFLKKGNGPTSHRTVKAFKKT